MGSGKKKSTNTYKPAGYIESGAQNALGLASSYANKRYTPFDRDNRVAELDPNEQGAIDLASASSGGYQGDINSARGSINNIEKFTDADIDAYMNPYIKGALDPAARELREQGLRRNQNLAGSLSSRGAFSGSRAILAQRESDELTDQGVGDLYQRGYAQAFDRGSALWSADQDRSLQQGESFMRLAGVNQDLINNDIGNLMKTGEVARSVDQMGKDFDYKQFIEERDWSGKQAEYLTNVLRGLKGSYTETNKTKTGGGSKWGSILGTVGTVVGAIYGGPLGAKIGGAAGKAVGGGDGAGGWADQIMASGGS